MKSKSVKHWPSRPLRENQERVPAANGRVLVQEYQAVLLELVGKPTGKVKQDSIVYWLGTPLTPGLVRVLAPGAPLTKMASLVAQ